jgi:hypothetical protein
VLLLDSLKFHLNSNRFEFESNTENNKQFLNLPWLHGIEVVLGPVSFSLLDCTWPTIAMAHFPSAAHELPTVPGAEPRRNSGLTQQPDLVSPCSCSSRRTFIPFRFKCYRSWVGFCLEIRFGSSPHGLQFGAWSPINSGRYPSNFVPENQTLATKDFLPCGFNLSPPREIEARKSRREHEESV